MAFERLVRAGDPGALAEAVDLYRGDFLAGFAFRGTLFEDWLMAERERLRELALEALARLLAHQQRRGGDLQEALQTALRLIALDPLQEPVHRSLMRLYSDLGRRGAALQQYQLCERVLRRELAVEPEEETKQLYREILRRTSGDSPIRRPIARRLARRRRAAWTPPSAGRRTPRSSDGTGDGATASESSMRPGAGRAAWSP